MLKIAVVEDQQEVRDELCRFIRQYAAENSGYGNKYHLQELHHTDPE